MTNVSLGPRRKLTSLLFTYANKSSKRNFFRSPLIPFHTTTRRIFLRTCGVYETLKMTNQECAQSTRGSMLLTRHAQMYNLTMPKHVIFTTRPEIHQTLKIQHNGYIVALINTLPVARGTAPVPELSLASPP